MKKINCLVCVLFLLSSSLYSQHVLTLEQSRKLALENNSDSKNSRLETEASQQVRRSAFTRYFPNISAGGMMFEAQKNLMEIESEGGNLPVYDGNPANLQTATQFAYFPSATMGLLKKGTVGFVNVVQPVFAGGRIVNGNRLASLGVEVSRFKEKLTKDEITAKTEEQYWLIVSLDEKMKTIISYEELLSRLESQVEDAYKNGLVMRNDLLKVSLKLSEIQLTKSKLSNGKKLAAMAFCQHIGIPYDSTLVLKDKLDTGELPNAYYVENSSALRNRTEYALLEKSVEAEDIQTWMKLGEYLPQAGIGVSGMYMKLDESDSRTLGMVYGTVSVPISDWWGGTHELEERSIKEEIAQNNFRNKSELLLLQMEKAWQDLTDAYKQVQLSEESKEQAEENLKVNSDSYENGIITVSDLLEAQALLQHTKDQLVDAKSNYIIKRTFYLKVTGRL